MKTQDPPQEVFGLGKKIERLVPDPKPHEKVREGVFKDDAGKMYTNLPDPPAPSVWDALKKAGMV